VAVVVSRLIAGMEPQLLIDGKTRDRNALDRPGGEAVTWILEVAAVDVGLAPVTVGVEDERVEIDPTAGLGDQFNANGAPVGLHRKAAKFESCDGSRLVVGVDGEVEVPMGASLATRERIDAPAPSDPYSTVGACKGGKHGNHV
jgi:hypothetical protein